MNHSGHFARTRHDDSRRGVTLLEVLVAMGVMVVGLLGMLALIPLGRMELVEAERLDNASTIGRWAFRDITVRGYLQPENWIDPQSGLPIFGIGPTPDVPGSLTPELDSNKRRYFDMTGVAHTPPVAPIVIDPLMLTPRKFANAGDDTGQRSICRLFPYSLNLPGKAEGMPELAGLAPKIGRVTLRSVPADVVVANPAAMMMRAEIASRFFRSTDDLNFDVPTDTSRRPIQVYTKTPSSNAAFFTNDGYVNSTTAIPNIAQRQFKGAYSWFLVAEPSLAECYSPSPFDAPAMGGPTASAVGVRQYRTWVVVCHQRKLNAVANETLARPDGIGERMVFVDFIDRNTARLRTGGAGNEADAMSSLDVKANQWLAVVGRYQEPLVGGNRYVMEWYRITSVADRPTHIAESKWYREVTLVGREFSGLGFSFIDEDATTYTDLNKGLSDNSNNTVQPMTGWGILVSGVRGVYEKSIQVDRPSLYSIRY